MFLSGQTAGDDLFALGQQPPIAFLVEMGDGHSGMSHLVGGSIAAGNPLIRIGIVGIDRRDSPVRFTGTERSEGVVGPPGLEPGTNGL